MKHFANEDKDTKLTALRSVMIRDIAVATRRRSEVSGEPHSAARRRVGPLSPS
jgi:hypothetical protein